MLVVVLVLIVGPKLFIEPGTKAFFQLSSVSDPRIVNNFARKYGASRTKDEDENESKLRNLD